LRLQRQTARLILRSAELEDLDGWLRVLAQPSVALHAPRFAGLTPEGFCQQFTVRQKSPLDSYWLSIFEKETHIFVGFCGLSGKGTNVYDAFYYLADASTGQGYAAEALLEMIQFALTTRGRQMVIARIERDNTKSQGVAKRAGMILFPLMESESQYFIAPPTLSMDRIGNLLMDAAQQEHLASKWVPIPE